MNDDPLIGELTLHIEERVAMMNLSREAVQVRDLDGLSDLIAVRLVKMVATWDSDHRVEKPLTWWDHWKVAHKHGRLAWLVKRMLPPRIVSYTASVALPDVPLPRRGEYIQRVAYWKGT